MDCFKAEMTVAKNYLTKFSANEKFTTDCLKNVNQDNIFQICKTYNIKCNLNK